MNIKKPSTLRVSSFIFACAVLFVGSLASFHPAHAQRPAKESIFSLPLGESRFISLPEQTQNIFVSDPSVATFLLYDNNTILVTGQSQGRAKVVLMNKDAQEVQSYLVEVGDTRPQMVTVYKKNLRETIACAPNCDPVINAADSTEYYNANIERFRVKDAFLSEFSEDPR